MMIRSGLLVALMALVPPAAASQGEDTTLVPMGTGTLAGVYYPVGVAVCRLVNMERRSHGIRCAATPSEGSVANIEALRAGEVDLAIVQSDVQAAALRGDDTFDGLRAIMSLHPEPVTVVARADAGVAGVRDLEGLRVSHGGPDWGVVLSRFGWTEDTFAESFELAPGAQARALCEDEIDAFALTIGHPAPAVREATLACEARLVPVTGPEIDTMVDAVPFYSAVEIPGGLYRGNPDPTDTFGPGATLVTRADVPDEVIATLVRQVFSNLDMLRGLNPVLQGLEAEQMATAGMAAPLHDAAAQYYREQGWLPE